jgi:hypothetical protein
MPSHTDKQPEKYKPSWLTPIHVAGNNQADTLAGEAATKAQLETNIPSRHKHNVNFVLKKSKMHSHNFLLTTEQEETPQTAKTTT